MANALLAAEREAPEEIHARPRRDFTCAEHGEALMRVSRAIGGLPRVCVILVGLKNM